MSTSYTVRTEAAIMTLLADNTTADISAQDLRDAVGTLFTNKASITDVLYFGEVRMFGFAGASLPSGWLECDGSAISRTTYSDLFSAIGTTFGVGDGSTTFNVPDFQGRGPIGVGQGDTAEGGGTGTDRTLGDKVGAEEHTLTESEMPSHTHTEDGPGVTGMASATDQETFYKSFNSQNSGSAGGDSPHNNMSPGLTVTFGIYAGA